MSFTGKSKQFCHGRTSVTAGFALAVSLSPATLHAQSDPSEIESMTVVGQLSDFGATKSSVPIVETARSISIETSEQFIDKGALNLSQTTSYIAGVSAETFGFATRGDWVHARGLELPRYRDSVQELFGSYSTTRAEVYSLEQVEILKGPASVLYGQGSPGGIVNYVSKTPKAQTETELVAELGTFNRKVLALDTTGPITGTDDAWLYRFVALNRDADTQVDYVTDDALMIMPSLSYAPSADTSFTLMGLHQSNKGDAGAQFVPVEGTLFPLADGSYIDQDVFIGEPGFNRYDTTSSQITLLAEHRINDRLSIEATALWREGETDYHQAWAAFTGNGAPRYLNDVLGTDSFTPTTVARTFYQADNSSEQYAADMRLNADFNTGAIEHQVLFGVQYQDVTTDSDTAYFYGGGAFNGDLSYVLDLANPIYTGAPDQSVFDAILDDGSEQQVEDTGIYLSDEISLASWRLSAGLRYDMVDNDDGELQQSDNQLSASIGMLYRFDSGIAPYASYAESFETVVGTDLDGNQLEPEEARQYEAGIKYEPNGFSGLFTLSFFDIEISNLANPNSLPGDAAQQQGVSELQGIEFEGRAYLGDFYVQLAAAVLDAQDPNGFELAGEPDSNAAVWMTWKPTDYWQGFKAGAGVRYVGESIAEDGTVRYETPDYTLGDLMLGFEFEQGLDLSVNLRNLTDEEYLTSCLPRGDCFPGVRRTVNASLRYQF